MKKRLLAGLMTTAMLAMTLAGCGSSSSSGEQTSAEGGETASSGDGYSMTLIMSLRDEFLSTLEAGSKAAAEELGVTLSSQDAQNDTGELIQFIESARNAGDDAVLVNLVDAETAQQCIEAAGDMKVVFVNRVPADTSVLEAGKSAAVVSDENTSGYYQGEFLANYFKEQGKTDIKYLMLKGTLGLVHTEQRSASVLKGLADNGINATEAAAPLVAEYDRATAMDMISPLLTTTEFDCIIANNDAMALGAVEAMKAQGLDPTSIPIVGIDATVDGVQAIKDGTLAMTVFQDANGQGYGAVKAAANLIEGNPINDGTDYETDETGNICWVPFEPVTPDNVADYE
ncbi:MAG TPA: substrate-binding domain-containing protein [Candidatus Agathobaculum merdavium]|nr:substrate-binding domain-containing protein [Candidatus Agathobaculum merdavium]